MTTIQDVYGFTPGEVDDSAHGIEIEVEAEKRLPADTVAGLDYHEDNSLRGYCAEYVSRPRKKNELKIQVAELIGKLNEYKPKKSFRTSVHVHSNVRGKSVNKVLSIATLYWLLEDPLTKYCGDDRWENLFCIRATSSSAQVTHLRDQIMRMESSPFDSYPKDTWKYCGMNLCPVQYQGTLEFRTLDGTLDSTRIGVWLDQMDSLVNECEFDTPEQVVDGLWRMKDPRKFVTKYIQPAIVSSLNVDEAASLVEQSAALVAPMAYSVDWSSYEKKMSKRFATAGARLATPVTPRTYADLLRVEATTQVRSRRGNRVRVNSVPTALTWGDEDAIQNNPPPAIPVPVANPAAFIPSNPTANGWYIFDPHYRLGTRAMEFNEVVRYNEMSGRYETWRNDGNG